MSWHDASGTVATTLSINIDEQSLANTDTSCMHSTFTRHTSTAAVRQTGNYALFCLRFLELYTSLRPMTHAAETSSRNRHHRPIFDAKFRRQFFVPTPDFSVGKLKIFTALYGMQTQSSDENSVRPSVTRVFCEKMVERSVEIYIPYERSLSLVF